MRKYIFTLKDNQLNIALISKSGKKTKVLSSTRLDDQQMNKYIENYSMVEMDQIKVPAERFINGTKSKAKTCEFVLGLDSIISRTITIPHLNKKDLASYMDNNMSTFFTVDMAEYLFDYKIVKEIKKTKKNEKQLQLKIVVVPRAIVMGISKLVTSLNLKLAEISIYPDVMQRLVKQDEALGVLDVGANRSILTIYDEGTTFIYTSIENQGEGYSDFTDEVEYFTDFFASRHGGQALENLYIIGDEEEYIELIAYMNGRISSHVRPIDYTTFRKRASEKDISQYPGIVLSQFKVKEIRGEAIDFSEDDALVEKKERSFEPAHLFLILALLTIGWFSLYNMYLNDEIALYERGETDDQEVIDLRDVVDQMMAERDNLLRYEGAVVEIYSRQYDYEDYFSKILDSIPADVNISEMVISKGIIQLTLSNIENTLDLLETIIALNESGYFYPVELENIALNDEINDFGISLRLISDESSQNEVADE